MDNIDTSNNGGYLFDTVNSQVDTLSHQDDLPTISNGSKCCGSVQIRKATQDKKNKKATQNKKDKSGIDKKLFNQYFGDNSKNNRLQSLKSSVAKIASVAGAITLSAVAIKSMFNNGKTQPQELNNLQNSNIGNHVVPSTSINRVEQQNYESVAKLSQQRIALNEKFSPCDNIEDPVKSAICRSEKIFEMQNNPLPKIAARNIYAQCQSLANNNDIADCINTNTVLSAYGNFNNKPKSVQLLKTATDTNPFSLQSSVVSYTGSLQDAIDEICGESTTPWITSEYQKCLVEVFSQFQSDNTEVQEQLDEVKSALTALKSGFLEHDVQIQLIGESSGQRITLDTADRMIKALNNTMENHPEMLNNALQSYPEADQALLKGFLNKLLDKGNFEAIREALTTNDQQTIVNIFGGEIMERLEENQKNNNFLNEFARYYGPIIASGAVSVVIGSIYTTLNTIYYKNRFNHANKAILKFRRIFSPDFFSRLNSNKAMSREWKNISQGMIVAISNFFGMEGEGVNRDISKNSQDLFAATHYQAGYSDESQKLLMGLFLSSKLHQHLKETGEFTKSELYLNNSNSLISNERVMSCPINVPSRRLLEQFNQAYDGLVNSLIYNYVKIKQLQKIGELIATSNQLLKEGNSISKTEDKRNITYQIAGGSSSILDLTELLFAKYYLLSTITDDSLTEKQKEEKTKVTKILKEIYNKEKEGSYEDYKDFNAFLNSKCKGDGESYLKQFNFKDGISINDQLNFIDTLNKTIYMQKIISNDISLDNFEDNKNLNALFREEVFKELYNESYYSEGISGVSMEILGLLSEENIANFFEEIILKMFKDPNDLAILEELADGFGEDLTRFKGELLKLEKIEQDSNLKDLIEKVFTEMENDIQKLKDRKNIFDYKDFFNECHSKIFNLLENLNKRKKIDASVYKTKKDAAEKLFLGIKNNKVFSVGDHYLSKYMQIRNSVMEKSKERAEIGNSIIGKLLEEANKVNNEQQQELLNKANQGNPLPSSVRPENVVNVVQLNSNNVNEQQEEPFQADQESSSESPVHPKTVVNVVQSNSNNVNEQQQGSSQVNQKSPLGSSVRPKTVVNVVQSNSNNVNEQQEEPSQVNQKSPLGSSVSPEEVVVNNNQGGKRPSAQNSVYKRGKGGIKTHSIL